MYNLSDTRTIKIMGIDPGTTNMGIGIIVANIDNLEIISSNGYTLNSERNRENSQYIPADGDDVYLRLMALDVALSRAIASECPDEFAMESPFMNPKRPQAYSPLVQCLTMIKAAIKRYRYTATPWFIPPSNVKNAVGAKGNCNKEIVRDLILSKENELKFSGMVGLGFQSEHVHDGLSIAYGRLHALKLERG